MSIYCHIQLIVSVRPSAPPHSSSGVFHGKADGAGGGSGSLDADIKQVLKVCLQYTLHPIIMH